MGKEVWVEGSVWEVFVCGSVRDGRCVWRRMGIDVIGMIGVDGVVDGMGFG